MYAEADVSTSIASAKVLLSTDDGIEKWAEVSDIIRLHAAVDGQILEVRVAATHTFMSKDETPSTYQLDGITAAKTWDYFKNLAPHLMSDTAIRNNEFSKVLEQFKQPEKPEDQPDPMP